MTEMPIIVIIFMFIVSTVIIALGYIYRSQFPMSAMWFIAGAMFLIVFITTDNLQLGYSEPEFIQTPIYSVSHPMNVTTSNTSEGFSTTITAQAERPINIASQLVGEKISCIEVNMLRTGSPTDNVMIGIGDNDARMVKLFGNITASTINTGTRAYQACLPNHDYWILAYNDYIMVKHTGSSVGNFISVSSDSTNPFDSGNSGKSKYTSGTWSDTSGHDLRMKLTTENLTIENTPIENTAEPINFSIRNPDTFEPTTIGIFFIILSLAFMMVGVLIERD